MTESSDNTWSLEEVALAAIEDLRSLARAHMGSERGSHTLQPTALVNEVWARLADGGRVEVSSRPAFIRYAARVMRNVLVDHARRHRAEKRGAGGVVRLGDEWDGVPEGERAWRDEDMLALQESLEVLEREHPRAASVVEMKFFGGATTADVASALGIGPRSVEKDWAAARAWLRGRLDG